MAARKRKITLSDEWREKIQAGNIMTRLLKHVDGQIEMSPTQVNAAKILLGKIVPDLARTEHVGDGGGAIQHEVDVSGLTPDQLRAIAQAKIKGDA